MKLGFDKGRLVYRWIFCAVAVLALYGFAAWPAQLALTITEGTTGRVVHAIRVQPGETFLIRYFHSVHRTPVEEHYRISAGEEMVLHRLVYESYGIGNPSGTEEAEQFRMEDGKLILEGMNRRFTSFRLRIAQITGSQELIIGGKREPFSAWSRPGSLIVLEVKRVSHWFLWMH